jgi:tetratricopeptide (TPR) repeat protein
VSDRTDKTPLPGQESSPDPLGLAEDDWLAAVDEWDAKLDLAPDAPPAPGAMPSPLAEPALPAPDRPVLSRQPEDPLVGLVTGDIEIPEDDGEALGALLGSPSGTPSGRPVAPPPAPAAGMGPPPTDEEVFLEAESAWDQLPAADEFGPMGAPPDRTRAGAVDDALLQQAGRKAPEGDFGDEFGEGRTRIVSVDEGLLRRVAEERHTPPPLASVDDFYDDVVLEQGTTEAPSGEAVVSDALAAEFDLGGRGHQGDKTPVPGELPDAARGRAGDKTPVPGEAPPPPEPEEAEIILEAAPAEADVEAAGPPAADEIVFDEPGLAPPAASADEIVFGEPNLPPPAEAAPEAAAAPLAPPAAPLDAAAGAGEARVAVPPDVTDETPPSGPPPAAEVAPPAPAETAVAPAAAPAEAAAPAPVAEAEPAAPAAPAEPVESIFGAVDELLRRPQVAEPAGGQEATLVGAADLEIVEPTIEAEEAGLEELGAPDEEAAAPGAALFPPLGDEAQPELPAVAAAPVVELRPEAFAVPEQAPPAPEARAYWEHQAELLQAELHLAGEDHRAAAIAYAAGRVFEVRLGDPVRARELYEHANNRDPQHGPTLRALRRLAARQGAWDDALTALELESAVATAPERQALAAWRAEVLLARGETAAAQAAYAQLLAEQPDDPHARLAVCDLAVLGDDQEEALRVLAATADAVEPGLRAELRLELARRLEHLGRDAAAAQAYRAAAEQAQPLAGALLGEWRVATRAGDAAAVADIEARLAGVLRPAAWALKRHEAGLRLGGDAAGARAAVEAAVDASGGAALCLATLAESHLAAGDVAAGAATLERLAAAATDPGRRAATLLRLADLRETKLGDAEGAAAALSRALEAAPDLVPAQLALERVSTRGAAPERLLAVARGAALTDPERAPFFLVQAARLLAHDLGRPEEAITELQRALTAAPAYAPAVRAQVRLLTESGRHRDAAEVLDRAAAALETDRSGDAANLREAAAAVAGRGLAEVSRPGEAGSSSGLAAVGGEADELDRLETLCRGADVAPALRWARLFVRLGHGGRGVLEDLAADAEAAVESARAAALHHLRGLLLDAEGRADDAAEAQRQVLALSARHPGAFAELLYRALATGAHAEAAELMRGRATAVAARASVAPSSDAAVAPGGAEAAALLHAAGAVLEQEAKDPRAAAAAFDELAALAPGYRPARDAQLRVARATADSARLASLLAGEVQGPGAAGSLSGSAAPGEHAGTTDPAQRLALLLALSDALAEAGDATRAVEPARHALELAPGDPLALGALTALYETSRNFAALAEFALADLKTATAPPAKVAAYERLAEIDADQRGDVHSAVLGYETILELDPAHAPTLRTLERYYLTQERWAELAATYEKLGRALQATHPRLAVEVHLARARLLEGKLAAGDAPAPPTLDLFRAAVQAEPHCLRALRRIEIAMRAANDAEGRIDSALRLADAVGDDARAAALFLTRAAELTADLGRVDEAVRLFTDAAAKEPGYLAARRGLRRLTLAKELWPQVAVAAEGEGESLKDRAQRASAFLLAGAVAQERLADPARAVADFRRVLEVEPDSEEAFTRLSGLLGARGEWAELAALLKQRTDAEKDPGKLVELHLALAEAMRDHLGDRAQAKAQLKAALHHAPQHRRALAAISALHYDDGDWAEAADAFFRRLRVERDREVLKDILFKLGLIYAGKLPDPKRAVAAFARVLQLDPENREALAHLADIHVKEANWKEAYTATARLAALEQEPEKKVAQMLRLADILDRGFKDQRRATEMYRKSLETDPLSLAAIGGFAKFYERQNDTRSAHVHLDTSITRFRGLLAQDPFDVRAYGALFQLFSWRGDPDRAHTAAQILGALGGTDERVLAYLNQAGARMEVAGGALAEPLVDDLLFPASVPAGFRHLFRLLGDALGKLYRADLKPYQVSRADRLPRAAHPIREIANGIAQALRLGEFDIYVSNAVPGALALENTDPPVIILGQNLVTKATHEELRFALGRTLKLLQLHMALPSRLSPKELGLLVSGVVRQFVPDFAPAAYEESQVIAEAGRVGKAIPRKLQQELMPFALECAGAIDWEQLVMDIVHVGNRAGLLLAGSVAAALATLRRAAGHEDLQGAGSAGSAGLAPTPEAFARACRGNRQIEELLRFAVSNEYLELRRQLGIARA